MSLRRMLLCLHLLLAALPATAGWRMRASAPEAATRATDSRAWKKPPEKFVLEPWAVVSLVSGILGLAPLAIAAAVIARRRIVKYSRRGENAANIGSFLGFLFLLPFAIAVLILLL